MIQYHKLEYEEKCFVANATKRKRRRVKRGGRMEKEEEEDLEYKKKRRRKKRKKRRTAKVAQLLPLSCSGKQSTARWKIRTS